VFLSKTTPPKPVGAPPLRKKKCGEKGNRAIELNYGIATNNIRQISSRLQKKGLLIPKHYKEGQGRELHPDLKSVRDNFVEGDHKFLLLQIWK
jgi:hypothetical protein